MHVMVESGPSTYRIVMFLVYESVRYLRKECDEERDVYGHRADEHTVVQLRVYNTE